MKQKLMISVIKKRFSNVQEYISRMLFTFQEEAVHNFRTEIKKLRAFLRLLNSGNNNRFTISKKIKVYYWYAGNIRNLQLHIKSVIATEGEKPVLYFQHVKKQLESLEGALRALHSPSNFDKPQKMIAKWKAKPAKPSVRKFVSGKVHEFKELLEQIKQDEIVHAIRKLLKDLLYNWKYIKEYRSLLPPAISAKKQITELTDVLGEFCDRNTGIHLLEAYRFTTDETNERNIFETIMRKWENEKMELRQKIYSLLNYNPA